MQAGEEAVPSARDGAAHPGDSSQPQEAERRVRGQSGDSQGGFQEGVHELTGRDGAGRAEHQGVQMQRKSLHRAVPAAGIADIPDVPGWLPGTWASAAWGQPSGAGGSDVWSPPPSTRHLLANLGDEGSQSGEAEDIGTAGMGAGGIPRGDGWREGRICTCTAATRARSLGTPSSHCHPPPGPGRMLNGGHSSASPPPAAGSCRLVKEPPRVPGAGAVAGLPGLEQDAALPWVQRAARGRDMVLFTW